uniref:Uncharacterized protein n=1 Tax=Timema douglasi TaxID=61478 RepID=A0A7R8VFP4_TIMDO|nr:unnamed protein product [Timema douglasi]
MGGTATVTGHIRQIGFDAFPIIKDNKLMATTTKDMCEATDPAKKKKLDDAIDACVKKVGTQKNECEAGAAVCKCIMEWMATFPFPIWGRQWRQSHSLTRRKSIRLSQWSAAVTKDGNNAVCPEVALSVSTKGTHLVLLIWNIPDDGIENDLGQVKSWFVVGRASGTSEALTSVSFQSKLFKPRERMS